MGAGAAATTYYDVVTRYYTQNRSAGELRGYSNSVEKASRSNDRLHRSTKMVGHGTTMMLASMAKMAAVMGTFAAGGYMVKKSFSNLNVEMNSTIQLASQLNLAFKYADNPAENFVASMRRAKGMFRDLVREAARLPGETSDFLGIGRMIAGPVFHAGGSTDQYTKLISKLALTTPAAGGQFTETGRGAMMMLQGRAIGKNPLTAYMMGAELLSGYNVTSYNALKAAERFNVLDKGLSKLVDNPMFRKAILGTFGTQLGTLSDTLFGVSGIGGGVLGEGFQDILSELTDFNVSLEKNVPESVAYLRALSGGIGDLAGGLSFLSGALGATKLLGWGYESNKWQFQQVAKASRYAKLSTGFEPLFKEPEASPFDWMIPSWTRKKSIAAHLNDQYKDMLWTSSEFERAKLLDPAYIRDPMAWNKVKGMVYLPAEAEGVDGEHRETSEMKVVQNFHIKVAISTDESPEAVAVKIRKAVAKASAHPTIAGRGIGLLPSGGGGSGRST